MRYLKSIFKILNLIFEIVTLKYVYLQRLIHKLKSLNLGSKMSYLGIFGLKFENNIFIFEISALEFVPLQSLVLKSNP